MSGGRVREGWPGGGVTWQTSRVRFPNFHVGSVQAVRRADRNSGSHSISLGPLEKQLLVIERMRENERRERKRGGREGEEGEKEGLGGGLVLF